jgi:hypothetical protein
MQATVLANGGTVFLPVDIDLAGVPTGTYVLALRPAHDSEVWQTYPLINKQAPKQGLVLEGFNGDANADSAPA